VKLAHANKSRLPANADCERAWRTEQQPLAPRCARREHV